MGKDQRRLAEIGLAVLCALMYLIIAAQDPVHGLANRTLLTYYPRLAQAFLRGTTALDIPRDQTEDLILYQGRWYVYSGPMPAVLMMPFVAVWGVGFTEKVFDAAVGGLCVWLFLQILSRLRERKLATLEPPMRWLLGAFFGLGTVLFGAAVMGTVTYTAQVCTALFLLLAMWAILPAGQGQLTQARVFASGAALTAAMLCRNHSALALPFYIYWVVASLPSQGLMANRAKRLAALALPLAVGVCALGYYNYARFGSPTDNGLSKHHQHPRFLEDFKKYGIFDSHYVAHNLYHLLLHPPYARTRAPNYRLVPFGVKVESPDEIVAGKEMGLAFLLVKSPLHAGPPQYWNVLGKKRGFPFLKWDTEGTSVLISSPLLLLAIGGARRLWRDGQRKYLAAVFASLVAVALPSLMLMGTGWQQFANRYSLDYLPFWLLFVAAGCPERPKWWWLVALAWSVFANVQGSLLMVLEFM